MPTASPVCVRKRVWPSPCAGRALRFVSASKFHLKETKGTRKQEGSAGRRRASLVDSQRQKEDKQIPNSGRTVFVDSFICFLQTKWAKWGNKKDSFPLIMHWLERHIKALSVKGTFTAGAQMKQGQKLQYKGASVRAQRLLWWYRWQVPEHLFFYIYIYQLLRENSVVKVMSFVH